ncbi:30S ribosomal protein S5 [Patescibacteria group bacterium]|nr:30S ribosomal protein S5 [Patescibacteria group bacterium]
MVREGKNKRDQLRVKPQSEFEQRIIDLARVTRVMAGGKRLRFRACVAVGDRKGKVGWAVAKGADVTIAVNKAATKAKKHLLKLSLVNETIPHQVTAKFKAARVLLKPAKKGTGVIAGGVVRNVLELAAIPNISAKILGSNNKINNIHCVFNALKSLKKVEKIEKEGIESPEEVKERDLEEEEKLEKEQEKLLEDLKEAPGIKVKE